MTRTAPFSDHRQATGVLAFRSRRSEQGGHMADDKGYDKARGLAEDALKKTVEGDDVSAEKLAEEAKATNQQAVEDVLQELDEDASSEHDPQRIKDDLGSAADKA